MLYRKGAELTPLSVYLSEGNPDQYTLLLSWQLVLTIVLLQELFEKAPRTHQDLDNNRWVKYYYCLLCYPTEATFSG